VKIGQVAAASGVSIDTIRFYERRGVLPVPPRTGSGYRICTGSGYRIYTDASVRRIRFTRRLQSLGLSLDEIIGALQARDQGHASCETQRWRLQAALDRIESRIAELARLRGEVGAVLAACAAGACEFTGQPRGKPAGDDPPPAGAGAREAR
jgi:DNA-binding transcriptional MerR regulator